LHIYWKFSIELYQAGVTIHRWAIVKDAAVAKKMVKFVELNTIGVSQDSQIRATQILKAVIQGCNNYGRQGNRLQLQEADQDSANSNAAAAADQMTISQHIQNQNLFHYGHSIMSYRWNRLRAAVASSSSSTFSLLDFSPDQCTFFGKKTTPTPGNVKITQPHDYIGSARNCNFQTKID
jgi:L-tryptophan--pyruvate aminotransferase